ncbi:MAG: hypothetical protein Q8R44_07385 [Novosphingobium sp.]|nr:hypothetical protein [Novosphingobium sp.]
MIWHEDYRGYQVSYQSGDQIAWIKPTHDSDPLSEKPVAGPGEGRVELRFKAHSVIDADISARTKNSDPAPSSSEAARG